MKAYTSLSFYITAWTALASFSIAYVRSDVSTEVISIYAEDVTGITLEALQELDPDFIKTQGGFAIQGEKMSLGFNILPENHLTGRRKFLRERTSHLVHHGNKQKAERIFQQIDKGKLIWIVIAPEVDNRSRQLIQGIAKLCNGIIVQFGVPDSKSDTATPAFYDYNGILLLGPQNEHARTLWIFKEAEERALGHLMFNDLQYPFPEPKDGLMDVYPALVRANLPPHNLWLVVGLRTTSDTTFHPAVKAPVLRPEFYSRHITSIRWVHQEKVSDASLRRETFFPNMARGESKTTAFELISEDREQGTKVDPTEFLVRIFFRYQDPQTDNKFESVKLVLVPSGEDSNKTPVSVAHRIALLAAEYDETMRLTERPYRVNKLRILKKAADEIIEETPNCPAAKRLWSRIDRASRYYATEFPVKSNIQKQ